MNICIYIYIIYILYIYNPSQDSLGDGLRIIVLTTLININLFAGCGKIPMNSLYEFPLNPEVQRAGPSCIVQDQLGAARPADHATQIGLDRAVNRGLQQLQPVAVKTSSWISSWVS